MLSWFRRKAAAGTGTSPAPTRARRAKRADGDLFDEEFQRRLEYLAIVSRRIYNGRMRAERRSKKTGAGIEFADHRDYVPGDPFKLIAWKASARAPLGRLLVRDLDRETLLLHTLLLDIGPGMREGAPGSWKLDHAIELCLAYSRAVDNDGDRVALLTYDNQVHSALRPGDGPAHRLRTAAGQRPHFTGHNRETTTLFSSARGLHCSIERKYVRLESNAINHTNNIDDFFR